MILDETLTFSDSQAITGDAASTNYIDLGAPGTVFGATAALNQDVGKSRMIPLLIQVTEAFNNLTSLTIKVQTDDNTSFSSAKDKIQEVVPLANLVVGKRSVITQVPVGTDERYVRLYFDVTGTNPSTGKIFAGIVAGVQTNGAIF